MESTVTQVIEQQLTGIDNLLYFSSNSSSNGHDDDHAELCDRHQPRYRAGAGPEQGHGSRSRCCRPRWSSRAWWWPRASPDILMFLALESNNPSIDAARLSDILASQIQPSIGRISGVGNTTLLGSEYANAYLARSRQAAGLRLATTQVLNAVSAQNAQFAAGARWGRTPRSRGRCSTATVSGDALFSLAQAIQGHHPAVQQQRHGGAPERRRAHHLRRADLWRVAGVQRPPRGRLAVFLLPGANALSVGQRREGGKWAPSRGTCPRASPGACRTTTTPVHHRLDLRRGAHPRRGHRPCVPRDAGVPAEHPGHDHPDARHSGRAAGHLQSACRCCTTR